jgi:hypothetical protein
MSYLDKFSRNLRTTFELMLRLGRNEGWTERLVVTVVMAWSQCQEAGRNCAWAESAKSIKDGRAQGRRNATGPMKGTSKVIQVNSPVPSCREGGRFREKGESDLGFKRCTTFG